jgi:hypothetical protein
LPVDLKGRKSGLGGNPKVITKEVSRRKSGTFPYKATNRFLWGVTKFLVLVIAGLIASPYAILYVTYLVPTIAIMSTAQLVGWGLTAVIIILMFR